MSGSGPAPAPGRPVPAPTPVTEPFWEGCKAGRFLLQRCAACGASQFYPRTVCSACGGAELEWTPAQGAGQVVSYTVVRRAITPAFAEMVPYVVAIVRLDEGPQLMSHIVGCDPDSVRVGAAVQVDFEDVDGAATLPVFRLTN